MPRCDCCGKNIPLPFHCQYCGRNFCDEHRLPPNHACAGIAEWKKTPAPGVGLRYGGGGVSAYGGGYAAARKKEKPGRIGKGRIPYLMIAAVLIVIVTLVVLFILLSGCVQPGENIPVNASITTGTSMPPTMPSPSPEPQNTSVTAGIPATPTLTTLPVDTPVTSPTKVRVRPTLTTAGRTTVSTTLTTKATTPTVSRSASATTATPQFTPPPGKLANDPYTISTTALADRIHELINRHRKAYGLSPLSWDGELTAIALSHSTDMATNNFFSHTNPAGQTPTDRGNAAGYPCRKDYGTYYTYGIAENIFQNNLYTSVSYENGVYTYDWTSPEDIAQSTVTGWMNSEGHKKNILTETYDREGIGIAIAADDKVYITENFC